MGAATTATAAAAATATTTIGLGEIVSGGDAAEFEGQADVFADLLLQAIELLLGIAEGLGNAVREQCLAGGFKVAHFGSPELDSGVLFLMQFLTAFVHALILEAGGIVIQEAFDVFLKL